MHGSTWSSGFQLAICDLWYLWIYMPHCRRPRRITQKSSSIISNCLYIHLSLMILTLNHDVCCFWPGIYPPFSHARVVWEGPSLLFSGLPPKLRRTLMEYMYIYIYMCIYIYTYSGYSNNKPPIFDGWNPTHWWWWLGDGLLLPYQHYISDIRMLYVVYAYRHTELYIHLRITKAEHTWGLNTDTGFRRFWPNLWTFRWDLHSLGRSRPVFWRGYSAVCFAGSKLRIFVRRSSRPSYSFPQCQTSDFVRRLMAFWLGMWRM